LSSINSLFDEGYESLEDDWMSIDDPPTH
jgi:hypothetical protein